jgi:hypothetical protein
MTRRATVEVFDPPPYGVLWCRMIELSWTELTSRRLECRTPPRSVCVILFFRFHETCLPNRCPAMDYSVYVRCSGNVCLASSWLAMNFHSGSTILAFRHHVTMLTQFVKTEVHFFTPCEYSFSKRNAKLKAHWINHNLSSSELVV